MDRKMDKPYVMMTDGIHSKTVLSIHNRQLNVGTNNICDCMHRPAQDQARQNPKPQGGGDQEFIPLTEEFVAVNSCWEESEFSMGMWSLESTHALVVGSGLKDILDHKWTL